MEINFGNPEKIRHEVKIENCIDENASMVYEIRTLSHEDGKNDMNICWLDKQKKQSKSPRKQQKAEAERKLKA